MLKDMSQLQKVVHPYAEGQFTKTLGLADHTEGCHTVSVGASAHAEGYGSLISEDIIEIKSTTTNTITF